jgi:hypothetical protein
VQVERDEPMPAQSLLPKETKLATLPRENKLTPICHSLSLLQGNKENVLTTCQHMLALS